MSKLNYQNADDARRERPGFLRSLFGPSTREVWQLLAHEVGGRFVDGGLFSPKRVIVTTGQWTLTLDTYRVQSGKSSTTYTRLRAPYVNRDGFRFRVYRSGLFSDIAETLGFGDIKVGDPAFDHAFVLKGSDERKVRALFSDGTVNALLREQPAVRFEVKDDEGWFSTHFPAGVDELQFTAIGVIKDVDRLRALFDLFAAVLHQLCAIGSAYEDDPRVQL